VDKHTDLQGNDIYIGFVQNFARELNVSICPSSRSSSSCFGMMA